MPKALAIFVLGSEVRQFGHSGLLSRLLDDGWQVDAAAKIIDDDLRAQLDRRVVYRPLPLAPLSFLAAQAQMVLDEANALRMSASGARRWSYGRAVQPANWKQAFLFRAQRAAARSLRKLSLLHRVAAWVERRLIHDQGKRIWSTLLDEARPDIILVNIPKAGNIAAGLALAKARNIPTLLLYHTWKDVTVASGRINHSFTAIGVWNEWMRSQLLEQNPTVRPQSVAIAGCLHFESIGRHERHIPEAAFRQLLGLKPDTRIILFTASAPWVVDGEEAYLEIIQRAIDDGELPADVEIVVRTNPMDHLGVLRGVLERALPRVLVTSPDWRWDRSRNWCFQRTSDNHLYDTLLHLTSVNVSVPSTVTVECAIADLPVVNIGFSPPPVESMQDDILSFWNADFYEDVRLTGAASLARSPRELIELVRSTLENRAQHQVSRQALVRRQLGVSPGEALEAAVTVVKDAYGATHSKRPVQTL